jgi:hypothetical protein
MINAQQTECRTTQLARVRFETGCGMDGLMGVAWRGNCGEVRVWSDNTGAPPGSSERRFAGRAQGGTAWHLLGQNEGHGFAKKEHADCQFWASLMFWKQTLLAESP